MTMSREKGQLLEDLKKAILEYAEEQAQEITQKIIEAKIDPLKVMNQTISEAARELGYKFENGEIFLPHLEQRSDYMESTGMSEMKVAYDELNRSAFALAHGVPLLGTHSSVIGGFSGNPEGASITAVAASLGLVTVHKAVCFRCGTVDARIKSRVTRKQLWVAGTAIQALNRNTRLKELKELGLNLQ